MFAILGMLLMAPIPKGDPEGTILLVKTSPNPTELILMKSGGTVLKRFEPKGIEGRIIAVRLNPPATHVAIVSSLPIQAAGAGNRIWSTNNLYLLDLDNPDRPAKLAYEKSRATSKIVWHPDGKRFLCNDVDETEADAAKPDEPTPYRSWILDPSSGKREPLKLPKGQVLHDISSDGKTLLTSTTPRIQTVADYKKYQTFLVPYDTLVPKPIADLGIMPFRLSPDGTAILGTRYEQIEPQNRWRFRVVLADVKTKTVTNVRDPDEAYSVFGSPCWTNRGAGVAMLWYERIEEDGPNRNLYRYCVSQTNRRGDSPKLVFRSEPREYFTFFDWR